MSRRILGIVATSSSSIVLQPIHQFRLFRIFRVFVFRVCVVHERNRSNQAEWVVAEWNAWHPKENRRRVPCGPRKANEAEIAAQNPKATHRLLTGCDIVFRNRTKLKAWGIEHVPETGPFITAATHVTMFDVFVPMISMFHQGRRPRYMAKAEMASWPLIGKWFQLVGMQPVQRRSGKAKAIEETSVEILTSGRPLTVWPEGTVTRDPQKWPMSMKNGVGMIALEASRRLGYQIPLYCAVTWGAASINHWWPWPRKNVVMCYDEALDYADLLADCDSWGEEVPEDLANELTRRIRVRMTEIMAEIRGEQAPDGYWDYRTMSRVKD